MENIITDQDFFSSLLFSLSFFVITLFYMEVWRQAKPADDRNTYISGSLNKILCTHRLQEGNSREEKSKH